MTTSARRAKSLDEIQTADPVGRGTISRYALDELRRIGADHQADNLERHLKVVPTKG